MKARLTALTAAMALSMSALVPAAQAESAAVLPSARVKAAVATWGYVSSKRPKKAFFKKRTALPVGRTGGAVYRSYFRLDLSDAMGEDIISSVRLRIPVKAPNPCRKGGAPAVKVQQTAALTAKATWKKQPKVVRTLGTVKPKCAGKVLDLNLTKAALRLQNDGGTDLTLRLVVTNEKKAKNFLKLSPAAKLTVKAYSNGDDGGGVYGDPGKNKPRAVTNVGLSDGPCTNATLRATTATFNGTVSDADGGFVGLRVQWERLPLGSDVTTADSQMQFATPDEARALKVTPPKNSFEDGKVYRWRLQGFDDVAAGDWSPWCDFTVDLFEESADPAPADPATTTN